MNDPVVIRARAEDYATIETVMKTFGIMKEDVPDSGVWRMAEHVAIERVTVSEGNPIYGPDGLVSIPAPLSTDVHINLLVYGTALEVVESSGVQQSDMTVLEAMLTLWTLGGAVITPTDGVTGYELMGVILLVNGIKTPRHGYMGLNK